MKYIFILLISIFSFFEAYSKKSNADSFEQTYNLESYGSGPHFTEAQVKARLEALPAKIKMTYSKEVMNHIERYVKKGRKQVTSILGRSAYYMPIFEKTLKTFGLPEELKYLPIIESGLNAKATSHRGAAGLWQFMPGTARGYDMEVGSSIDERRDPYLSSEKACTMLRDLYEMFGDWHLVLAAYNAGPGTVQKALRKANGRTFKDISPFLPAETRNYVPLFIAMNYVMNYYADHNIAGVTEKEVFKTDTIHLREKGSLKDFASRMDMPVEDLRSLNPHYTGDLIPASKDRHRVLILPSDVARDYKIKHGRYVEAENNYPEERSVADNSEQHKKDKLRNWDDLAFEDVPSKTMPGTYVRVARKTRSPRLQNSKQ